MIQIYSSHPHGLFLFFVFESYLVCCDPCVVDGIKKDVIRRVCCSVNASLFSFKASKHDLSL